LPSEGANSFDALDTVATHEDIAVPAQLGGTSGSKSSSEAENEARPARFELATLRSVV
jgi:hypothetical protein